MFNNIALDVFIGLVFIFLLYSLLATIIQEFIATRFAFRSRVLEKAILRMLEDGKTTTRFQIWDRIQGFLHLIGVVNILKGKSVAPWFYAHPLIKYLAEDNYYSKPAYLDAENFSKVIIDLLKGFGFPESQVVQSIHNSIMEGRIYKLPINLIKENQHAIPDSANPAIKVLRAQNENVLSNDLLQYETVQINKNTALYLKSIWQESGADITVFKQKLEDWFNYTMDRATGWYKRYTRALLFIIGLILAYSFNVDTIAIHRILSKDKNAREQLVQLAIRSQDKLESEVDQQRKGETVSDTILKNTYDLVSKDAQEATRILGLGRVWKDTCNAYEDSLKNTDFNKRLEDLTKTNSIIRDSIQILQTALSNLRQEKETTPKTLRGKPGTLASKMIRQDSVITADSLKLYQYQQSPSLKEYERMKAFISRCEFIKKEIGNRWFVYAPNQSGNWETLFGWLITALAVTLGAPFWFDLLSKLIKIRGSGSKIDPSVADSDTGKSGVTSPPASSAPVAINVNSNAGEEAVG